MDRATSVRVHHCATSVVSRADLGVTLLGWILADMKRHINAMAQLIVALFAQKAEIVLHRNADWPAEAALVAAGTYLASEIWEIVWDK